MNRAKPVALVNCAAGSDVCSPEGVMPGYPCLGWFMTALKYDDGVRRQLPSLSLFLNDGRLTACLNDKDNSRSAFVSGDSLASVLGALEAGLEADSLGWRPAKAFSKKK